MTRAKRYRAAAAVASFALAGLAAPAEAVLPRDQEVCLATFGKAVRDVAKVQAKTASRCLKKFAAGTLVGSTPEACLLSDPGGRLARTAGTVAVKIAAACPPPPPAFGVSPLDTAMPRVGLGVVDLLHDAIGDDLDTALVPTRADASCQAQVANALLRCVDTRRRTFFDCQREGLADGGITDASALEARCLGRDDELQPDPDGRIALACGHRLATVVSRHCGAIAGMVWLEGALDARLGMDLDFLPDGSGLAIRLAEPAPADTVLAITYNPLGVDEAQLEAALPGIIRPLVPELAGALSGFPLPTFFGLALQGVEVSRNGDFLSLFANLVPLR
jgi:hypothetical protein